jgi:hypothetical protein
MYIEAYFEIKKCVRKNEMPYTRIFHYAILKKRQLPLFHLTITAAVAADATDDAASAAALQ